MGLARKFFTVSGFTVVSRVLGIIREMLLAHFLGASAEMDAFNAAYKFPNFFRRFFADGGFQSVFVPYFTDFSVAKKPKGAKYFSSRVLSLVFWGMLIITILVEVFAEEFALFMAPGFAKSPEKFEMTVNFTRVMFPSVALIALSTVYSGILISKQKFFLFSLYQALVNFLLISFLLIGRESFSTGWRISFGTLTAGIFILLYMAVCVKCCGFPVPRLSHLRLSRRMRSFLKKLFPVLLGAGLAQVNVFIGSFFSSFLKDGSLSCLYYADRFIQLPIALFGISMGIVLLPEIAAKVASGAKADLGKIQGNSLLFSMRLTLPTVGLIMYLAYCLVSLIYGHGKFDENAVQDTTAIVKISTIGLPALIVARVMSAIFFARKDSTTPLLAAAAAVATNLILCSVLAEPFQVSGIAMASSAAGVVDMLVMYFRSRKWFRIDKTFAFALVRVIAASVAMMVALYILCPDTVCSSKFDEVFLVCSSCVGGFALYAVLLFLMRDEVAVGCFAKICRSKK